MRTFNDTQGRRWVLDVNIGTLKRVKSLVGVDLLSAREGQLLSDLADNPVLLADILFACCQPECQQKNVTDEEFGSALGGDTIRVATDAFVEELIDFFLKSQPAAGKTLQTLWRKLGAYQVKAGELAEEKLADPRMDEAIKKVWDKASREVDERLQTILGS